MKPMDLYWIFAQCGYTILEEGGVHGHAFASSPIDANPSPPHTHTYALGSIG